jgi:hypothetical protein
MWLDNAHARRADGTDMLAVLRRPATEQAVKGEFLEVDSCETLTVVSGGLTG